LTVPKTKSGVKAQDININAGQAIKIINDVNADIQIELHVTLDQFKCLRRTSTVT